MRYLIIPIVLMLGACSYLAPAGDKAAEYIAKGVDKYCTEFDAAARQRVKDKVGAAVAPNTISVTCAVE
jgi:hypothetical protein